MRIGELAVKSGVSRDTIRFYERNGLITSQAGLATTNNYRVYPDDSLIWLGFLTGAREAGLSIADLRSIVEATSKGCDREQARGVITNKIAELTSRAAEIDRATAFLRETLLRL